VIRFVNGKSLDDETEIYFSLILWRLKNQSEEWEKGKMGKWEKKS